MEREERIEPLQHMYIHMQLCTSLFTVYTTHTVVCNNRSVDSFCTPSSLTRHMYMFICMHLQIPSLERVNITRSSRMPNVTHTVAQSKEGYSSLVFVIIDPAFLGHMNKIVSIPLRLYFDKAELEKTLLYHVPGVGLLWSGDINESLDVSVCADCVEVKGVGETAAVRGNRATHLKPFEYTESLYNCNHFTYMHSHCPYHLHVVDHVEAELVLTANTTSTAHKHHPMDPPAHCPTLRYLQEEASLRGGHTERVCAATVYVDGAGLTSGGERTAERRV